MINKNVSVPNLWKKQPATSLFVALSLVYQTGTQTDMTCV
jgi:hypothetical protein